MKVTNNNNNNHNNNNKIQVLLLESGINSLVVDDDDSDTSNEYLGEPLKSQSRNCPPFVEPGVSLPHSREPSTRSYPGLRQDVRWRTNVCHDDMCAVCIF